MHGTTEHVRAAARKAGKVGENNLSNSLLTQKTQSAEFSEQLLCVN